jgi:D-xylose transport system permease protein
VIGRDTAASTSADAVLEETTRGATRHSYSLTSERRTWRLLGLIAIMGVMWIVFHQITDGIYITPRNLTNLMVQAAITGVVAVGVGMLLIAREIDLSVGSLLGVVVVASVWLQVEHRWSAFPTIAVVLLLGLGVGLFQGLCTTWLRIPSFIVTLAGFSYLRGVAYGITGSVTLFGTTSSFRWFSEGRFSPPATVVLVVGAFVGLAVLWLHQRWLHHRQGGLRAFGASIRPVELASTAVGAAACVFFLWIFLSEHGLPAPVAILGGVALFSSFVLRHTAFGRHVYAIGGNPEAARRVGIRVSGVIIVLFMFSGLLAALGGVIQAARLDAGPPTVGLLLALDAISAAVVGGTYLFGGKGSIGGILVGTLFLASIQNGLNLEGVATYWQYIVSGTVLLGAVAVDQLAQRRTEREFV